MNPLLLLNLLPSLSSLLLCCSTSSCNRGDSRRCRYSYISIYPFLMAPCFPEMEPSYSGSVGPVMLSVLVATLCNLRGRVYDLGSALTAIPEGRDMSISSGPQMKKTEGFHGLCWANICEQEIVFNNYTSGVYTANLILIGNRSNLTCCPGDVAESRVPVPIKRREASLSWISNAVAHCPHTCPQKPSVTLAVDVSSPPFFSLFSSFISVHPLIAALN